MSTSNEMSDADLEAQFRDCTLNPTLFNHEAHVRLAWIHISKYGLDAAIRNLRSQIQRYAFSLGATDKYNETVTIAAVKAVDHFLRKSTAKDFQSFIEDNPRLKYNFKELLAKHYATDIFKSESAKKEFLEPELLPFD